MESADLYAERYWEFDEWTRRGIAQLGAGKILIGSEVWPEPEFLQSVFYNEFLKQYDLDICSVAAIGIGSIPGKFDGLSIYRGHSDREFTAENTAVLSMLQAHLKVALATKRRLSALETKVADLENAFNSIESAVVLLDAGGRVILANAAAHSILNRGDGLYLSKSKMITTSRSRESAKLVELISKAIATAKGKGHFGGGVMPFARPGRRPLQLLVSPLCSASAANPGRAVVAVFLADPEQNPAVPTDVLRTLFGLSPAEARLALSVFEGNSLSEAAELNRVSRETVKSQMSAVFAKTGTRRQGELVRLLSSVRVLKD